MTPASRVAQDSYGLAFSLQSWKSLTIKMARINVRPFPLLKDSDRSVP